MENFKRIFNIKYKDIYLNKKLFSSQTKNYVQKFVNLDKKSKSQIIEVHNRPSYIHIINSQVKNKILTVYRKLNKKKLNKNAYNMLFYLKKYLCMKWDSNPRGFHHAFLRRTP